MANSNTTTNDKNEVFEVERPAGIVVSMIPGILLDPARTPNLSGGARSILLAVFSRPSDGPKPSKAWLLAMAGISDSTWKKYARELQAAGWLIRNNYGGRGRGNWVHERTFLWTPKKNPLE